MPFINWKLKPKNLIEVTAKHWHPGPACTSRTHNDNCANFGREIRCAEAWVSVTVNEKVSLGCTCEHHVGPDFVAIFEK